MNEDLILTLDDYAMTKYWERCVLFAYPDPASPLAQALVQMGLWYKYLDGHIQIPPAARRVAARPGKRTNGEPWTIGYGHTGHEVHEGLVWTQDQANSQLVHDMGANVDVVKRHATRELRREQLIALADFVHNVGEPQFAGSTLLKLLNQNHDEQAADEFRKWNISGGHVVEGLEHRREAERAQFLLGSTLV